VVLALPLTLLAVADGPLLPLPLVVAVAVAVAVRVPLPLGALGVAGAPRCCCCCGCPAAAVGFAAAGFAAAGAARRVCACANASGGACSASRATRRAGPSIMARPRGRAALQICMAQKYRDMCCAQVVVNFGNGKRGQEPAFGSTGSSDWQGPLVRIQREPALRERRGDGGAEI
jgi:hypothetical protein